MRQERRLVAGLTAPPAADGRHQPPRARRRSRPAATLVVQHDGPLDGLGAVMLSQVLGDASRDAPAHQLSCRLDVAGGVLPRHSLKSSNSSSLGLRRATVSRLDTMLACLLLFVRSFSGCLVQLVVT